MIKTIACLLLRGYQRGLSPIASVLGAQCRYYPSCSTYAIQAFQTLPLLQAAWSSLRRLLSCHPWHHPREEHP